MQSTVVICFFIWCSHIVNFWVTLFKILIVIQPQRLREQSFPMPCTSYGYWYLKQLPTDCSSSEYKSYIYILYIKAKQNEVGLSLRKKDKLYSTMFHVVQCSSDLAEAQLF